MANPEQLARLKLGSIMWNEWRRNNRREVVNLGGADLDEANLGGARFIMQDILQANLDGVQFSQEIFTALADQADHDRILRSIEFAPEYYQSGLTILSYFGQVLRDKYPNTEAKVTIEQDGLTVRMIIETPEGEREQIEETLRQYGLVATGKMPPAQFLSNELQLIRLEHKLETAVSELRVYSKLLASEQERSRSLEEDKKRLYALLEHGISADKENRAIITKLLSNQNDIDAILQGLEKLAGPPDNMRTDKVGKIVVELQQTHPGTFNSSNGLPPEPSGTPFIAGCSNS